MCARLECVRRNKTRRDGEVRECWRENEYDRMRMGAARDAGMGPIKSGESCLGLLSRFHGKSNLDCIPSAPERLVRKEPIRGVSITVRREV